MALTRAKFRCRFSIASTIALLSVLALAPSGARAGTYDVVACDAAANGGWSSWSGTASPGMSWGAACPTQRSETRGLWMRNSINTGTVAPFGNATMTFDAPAGTSIVHLGAQYSIHRKDSYWHVGLFADGSMIRGCAANDTGDLCQYSTAWPGTTENWSWANGVHKLYAQVACGSPAGCSTAPDAGSPLTERAGVRLFSATVRVRDDSLPTVNAVDGALSGGDWVRGSQFIGYSASDNVGIRATHLYVDGARKDDLDRACDFTQRVPCSNLSYARYTVDTQALTDGTHQVRVEAVDTAGNAQSVTRTIHVDNHAPAIPDDVTVDGGEGWRQTNDFKLGWTAPASAAPITVAHYELCDTSDDTCVEDARRGDSVSEISGLTVPDPGDYTLRVWLEDAAGNVAADNRSVPVHLRFDNVPPGQAEPRKRNGWVGAEEAKDVRQYVDMRPGEFVPRSLIAGYSISVDGSDPDASLDTTSHLYDVGTLPEGVTILKARAISGSGVPSLKVGETDIHVDKTPPSASVEAPAESTWNRSPVALHFAGTDQVGLSGMDGAPTDEPVEKGGFITRAVDGGPAVRDRGNSSETTLADDGLHTITYSATDVAGNESPQQTVHVKVDQTAPELVVFEAVNPADPRRLEVAASDKTSGVAGGVIEYRRLSGGDGAWIALRTTKVGTRLISNIDDDALPHGVYQLRARVTDNAGNEATGDHRRDGSVASFDTATLRQATNLAAGLIDPGKKARCKAKPKHNRGKKKKRCKKARVVPPGSLVASLTAQFGKSATARGSLTNAAGGPLPAARVEVYAKQASAGAVFKAVAHLRTDAAGNFAYGVSPGPGRVIRFAFAGSPRQRASHGDVTLRVPASATIRSNKKTARNGQRVRFTGRLRSLPIPASGKVIDLQAFYRGRWRTFATPRATANGAWKYIYRFGATRGRVDYRFRVVVRPESGYPFDLGYSKSVRVRVSGR